MLRGLLFGDAQSSKFIGMATILVLALALPLASVLGLSTLAWRAYTRESSYHHRYGNEWKPRFEEEQGSLNTARIKIGAEIFGVVINAGLGIWFYRMLIPTLRDRGLVSNSSGRSRRKRRRSQRPGAVENSRATSTPSPDP